MCLLFKAEYWICDIALILKLSTHFLCCLFSFNLSFALSSLYSSLLFLLLSHTTLWSLCFGVWLNVLLDIFEYMCILESVSVLLNASVCICVNAKDVRVLHINEWRARTCFCMCVCVCVCACFLHACLHPCDSMKAKLKPHAGQMTYSQTLLCLVEPHSWEGRDRSWLTSYADTHTHTQTHTHTRTHKKRTASSRTGVCGSERKSGRKENMGDERTTWKKEEWGKEKGKTKSELEVQCLVILVQKAETKKQNGVIERNRKRES